MIPAEYKKHWETPEFKKKLEDVVRITGELSKVTDEYASVYVCGINIYVKQPRFTTFNDDQVRGDSILVARCFPGGRIERMSLKEWI